MRGHPFDLSARCPADQERTPWSWVRLGPGRGVGRRVDPTSEPDTRAERTRGPRAERTRHRAPTEPERPPFVRLRAVPCGPGPGCRASNQPATGHFDNPGGARVPLPRPGCSPLRAAPGRPRAAGGPAGEREGGRFAASSASSRWPARPRRSLFPRRPPRRRAIPTGMPRTTKREEFPENSRTLPKPSAAIATRTIILRTETARGEIASLGPPLPILRLAGSRRRPSSPPPSYAAHRAWTPDAWPENSATLEYPPARAVVGPSRGIVAVLPEPPPIPCPTPNPRRSTTRRRASTSTPTTRRCAGCPRC